jgi:hypothetical protein
MSAARMAASFLVSVIESTVTILSALNRTFLTFLTVVLRRKAHSFATRNVAYWPLAPDHVLMADGRYRS